MHRAVLSILAGHVFPRPAWRLRWRLWAFYRCVKLQQWFSLVPRRQAFSLVAAEPVEWSAQNAAIVAERSVSLSA